MMRNPILLSTLLSGLSLVACGGNSEPARSADSEASDHTADHADHAALATPAHHDYEMRPASSDALEPGRSDEVARTRDSDPYHHNAAPPPAKAPEPAAASAPVDKTKEAAVAPDNTKVNQRDTKAAAPTPMDQGEGRSDLDITQRIRQAVVADRSLSFTAKNVKIITRDGKVVLRGPVASAAERASIEAAANKVAGSGNVDNQIEVTK
ncbi:MAG TPA: BON domain-containing protein [Polyangiaceae bacterium]|nr:BON domain-containing protein [Polyangiaceae bacterium]